MIIRCPGAPPGIRRQDAPGVHDRCGRIAGRMRGLALDARIEVSVQSGGAGDLSGGTCPCLMNQELDNGGGSCTDVTARRRRRRHVASLCIVTPDHLLGSRDGGRSWLSIGSALGAIPSFCDMAVDPSGSGDVYAATPRGVFRLVSGPPGTAVLADSSHAPRLAALAQNYPNPFNADTVIPFSLPEAAKVRVTIHSLLGQTLRGLVDHHLGPGRHAIRWDGRNDAGQRMSSGVYVYRRR